MTPVQAEHEQYLATRHFGSLDGVRCLAILAVLWHHSDLPALAGRSLFLSRGFLGVDLFFVLSGFLIVTLLLREKSRTGEISLRKFYVRRTLRIFPAYYGMLAVLTLVYLAKPRLNTAAGYFECLPYYLTYTSNWSRQQAANLAIMWSLAAEEQFYVVWPTIEKLMRPSMVYLTLGAAIVINQLINFGFLDGLFAWLYGTDATLRLPILESTFTPIALGVGVAHLLHDPRGFRLAADWLGNRTSPAWLLLALLGLVALLPVDLSGWPRLTLHLGMACWLTSLVVRENHILRPFMAATPIAFVGMISYGMYLYHLWVFHAVRAVCRTVHFEYPAGVFALCVAATVGFAAISFRYYESRFLQLKGTLGGVVD